MEERFFYCETCGNLLLATIASGIIPYCCGEEMTLLTPNTSDGNHEKHLPVVELTSAGNMVITIGSVLHPMTPEHNIRFVCLVTSSECIIHYLDEGEQPSVLIYYRGTPLAAYAYCNLHGLWRVDIEAEEG